MTQKNQSSPTAPTPPGSSQKWSAIAMMLVFLAPVVIAYIFLETGIYQKWGTSNKGILLEPPSNILKHEWRTLSGNVINPEQLQNNWWLAYELPAQCDEVCQQRLLQLRQSIQTLGPDQHRVQPLILVNEQADQTTLKLWTEQLDGLKVNYTVVANESGEKLLQGGNLQGDGRQLESGGLYVVDPMGFVMLYYAPAQEQDAAIAQAKSLIKDLKYLLKVSRIG